VKPPTLGAGEHWLIRSIDWQENIDGEIFSRCALLYSDAEVHEHLHDVYFETLPRVEKAIAILREVGEKLPYVFGLLNAQNQLVGGGALASGDGAHHVAWLFCFFLELGFRMCLSAPKATPGAKFCDPAPLNPDARRRLEAIVNGR
jgi:hypothetical protein